MWIADVAPYATIQSLWGNNVRDRVVQTFTDPSEANAHVASLPEGATCVIASSGLEYVKRSGVWKLRNTALAIGSIQDGGFTNLGMWSATLNAPSGYVYASLHYSVNLYMYAGGPGDIEVSLTRSNGATVLYSGLQSMADGAHEQVSIAIPAAISNGGDVLNAKLRLTDPTPLASSSQGAFHAVLFP
jgi:hypothetical protein